VTDRDKHSSLLQYGTNYSCKTFLERIYFHNTFGSRYYKTFFFVTYTEKGLLTLTIWGDTRQYLIVWCQHKKAGRQIENHFNKFLIFISVQLDSGQFQEQSQEYQRWKEWRDKVAGELRQSVSNSHTWNRIGPCNAIPSGPNFIPLWKWTKTAHCENCYVNLFIGVIETGSSSISVLFMQNF